MPSRYLGRVVGLAPPGGGRVQAYGFQLREARDVFDGAYCFDRPAPRRAEVTHDLAFMFKRYTVLERNETGERFLVARMSVERASRRLVHRYEPEAAEPSRTFLRDHLEEEPDPRLQMAWLPELAVWGTTAVGCAGGVVVDRRALGRAVGGLPEATTFLRGFFLEAGADPLEETRAEYRSEVARVTMEFAALAARRAALEAVFDEVVTPGSEWPRHRGSQ